VVPRQNTYLHLSKDLKSTPRGFFDLSAMTAFLENGTVSSYLGSGTHSGRGPPMTTPSITRTTRNTQHQPTRESVPLALWPVDLVVDPPT
jgi:hypothetical protein